jgi:hypothetical protein
VLLRQGSHRDNVTALTPIFALSSVQVKIDKVVSLLEVSATIFTNHKVLPPVIPEFSPLILLRVCKKY